MEHPNSKYVRKYDDANTTQIRLKLNHKTDTDAEEYGILEQSDFPQKDFNELYETYETCRNESI